MAAVEEKKKAATKNATAVAEAKKRKGAGAPRAVAKKLKVAAMVEASTASAAHSASWSARASVSMKEGSVGNFGRAPMPLVAEAKKIAALEDTRCQPEPSAVNPLPGVFGGDSSNSEGAEDARRRGAPPTGDARAWVASQRRPATVEVEDVSEDEVDSRPSRELCSILFLLHTQRPLGATARGGWRLRDALGYASLLGSFSIFLLCFLCFASSHVFYF